MTTTASATASGTYSLGGDLPVVRLGYGAMRITGPGVWGEPVDREAAKAVVRRVVELGVTFIDTADSYGPDVSEQILAEALHPYGEELVIATKAGLLRTGPGAWPVCGRPEYLRQQLEMSLRYLRRDCLDVWQLHRIDPSVPLEDQLGVFAEAVQAGKVRHVGLSEVSVSEIERAREIVPIASVQNQYNLADRKHEDVLDHCEREGIAFIPWFPVAAGELARPGGPLDAMASAKGVTVVQLALAFLLRRSPVVLPIPGTSSIAHLEENCAAAQVELSDEEYATLLALG